MQMAEQESGDSRLQGTEDGGRHLRLPLRGGRADWVGRAPDLATIENCLRFTLRHGSHRQRSLQAAWNAHGPDAFRFEALERLEDEDIVYVRDRVLKERLAHWQAKLGAEAI